MGWIADLLKEVPMSAVMKERLTHEEKLHEDTKAKKAELQIQVDELTKEVAALKGELAALKARDQFIQRSGLLWKPSGEGPFCPKCHGMMNPAGSRYGCPMCGTFAGSAN